MDQNEEELICKYINNFPFNGEIVLITIEEMNDICAKCKLLEYEDCYGYIYDTSIGKSKKPLVKDNFEYNKVYSLTIRDIENDILNLYINYKKEEDEVFIDNFKYVSNIFNIINFFTKVTEGDLDSNLNELNFGAFTNINEKREFFKSSQDIFNEILETPEQYFNVLNNKHFDKFLDLFKKNITTSKKNTIKRIKVLFWENNSLKIVKELQEYLRLGYFKDCKEVDKLNEEEMKLNIEYYGNYYSIYCKDSINSKKNINSLINKIKIFSQRYDVDFFEEDFVEPQKKKFFIKNLNKF